jgi:hypothetical protein
VLFRNCHFVFVFVYERILDYVMPAEKLVDFTLDLAKRIASRSVRPVGGRHQATAAHSLQRSAHPPEHVEHIQGL